MGCGVKVNVTEAVDAIHVFLRFRSRFLLKKLFDTYFHVFIKNPCQKQSTNIQKSSEKHALRMPQQLFSFNFFEVDFLPKP